MQEQKCRHRAYRIIDVVRSSQAGWKVVTPHWQIVKFPPGSASLEVEIVAGKQVKYTWKTADPTLYTNYKRYLLVICATAAQTECYKQVILHSERIHKSIDWNIYIVYNRDFKNFANPLFMVSVKQWVVYTQEYHWTAWFDLPSKSTPITMWLKVVSSSDWRFHNVSGNHHQSPPNNCCFSEY